MENVNARDETRQNAEFSVATSAKTPVIGTDSNMPDSIDTAITADRKRRLGLRYQTRAQTVRREADPVSLFILIHE